VFVRQGAPVFGVPGTAYPKAGGWQVSLGFRSQYSDKHFVGDEEQEEREELGSEVKNSVFTFDFGVTHQLTDRVSISASLPYQIGERSQQIGGIAGITGERNVTSARGIGDLIVTARRWMLDPATNEDQNVSLGLGLKFPTGKPNNTDVFQIVDSAGVITREVRTVDQSIQLGDGGWGLVVDVSAFKQFGRVAPYFNGTYVITPQETNGVKTYRSGAGEGIMSIADQYMWRTGVQWSMLDNLALGLGVRMEGVPVEDIVGGDDGFRRPGYSIGIEPSVAWRKGRHTLTFAMPWAIKRNRLKSVPDQERGTHGDAAFADYVILLGWAYAVN
jgi:hypothetical protein